MLKQNHNAKRRAQNRKPVTTKTLPARPSLEKTRNRQTARKTGQVKAAVLVPRPKKETTSTRRRSTDAKEEKKDDEKKRREDRQKRKDDKPKERTKPASSAQPPTELDVADLTLQLRNAMSPSPPTGCNPNNRILHLLRKLDRGIASVTLEDLQISGLGKLVRRLTKKRPTVITELAQSLLGVLLQLCQNAMDNTTVPTTTSSLPTSSDGVPTTDVISDRVDPEEEEEVPAEAKQPTTDTMETEPASVTVNGDTTVIATPGVEPLKEEEPSPAEPSTVPTEQGALKREEEEEPRAAMSSKMAPAAVPAPAPASTTTDTQNNHQP
eukprot:TRINITY_DN3146_c0_g1_i4.p1 TRINITY_DN3146_c0_g1~~TRINITY_DN3146_c0_g1_i4.p1  ORF type:complete len:324 (+),score=65.70 TRINITY_DN3146_c0_g1_i4:608-1579(+)